MVRARGILGIPSVCSSSSVPVHGGLASTLSMGKRGRKSLLRELHLASIPNGPAEGAASGVADLTDEFQLTRLEQIVPTQRTLGNVAVWPHVVSNAHSSAEVPAATAPAEPDAEPPSLAAFPALSARAAWPPELAPGAWTGRKSTLAALRAVLSSECAPHARQPPRATASGGRRSARPTPKARPDASERGLFGEREITKSAARRERGKHSYSVKQVRQRSRRVESRRAAGREAQALSLAIGLEACRV